MAVHRTEPVAPGEWYKRGACRSLSNEQHDAWFFPPKGKMTAPARAICGSCPVRAECLDHAMTNHEMYGLWGGTDELDRRRMRKAQGVAVRAVKEIEHGTPAGFKAHLRRDEKPCERCRIAKVEYELERRRLRGKE